MTGSEIPLGRKESQGLEFKGRDSLRDRRGLGREVVGMLNAEGGGEIWLGLAEEEHRAVRLEGIPEAGVEARDLRDFLMDSLEPAPVSGEIQIEVVAGEAGEEVLCVGIEGRTERRPYALLRRGGRHFVLRVGDRLRPMTREEVVGSKAGESDPAREGLREIREEEERLRRRGERLLWLRLQPVPGGRLDLQHPDLEQLLTDPTRTGNQRARRTYADAAVYGGYRTSLRTRGGRSAAEIGSRGSGFTRIYRDGGLEVEAALDHVLAPPAHAPLGLAELLVSVLRLLRGLLEAGGIWEQPPGDRVLGQLALFGLEGEILEPRSARSGGLLRDGGVLRGWSAESPPAKPYPERDFTLDRPLDLHRAEILDTPDRIAFRMLRELYEAFGYPESELPREFDRKTGRLVLPE